MGKYDALNAFAKEAYEISKSKGWKEPPPTVGEAVALIHSEASEVLEDYRAGHGLTEVFYPPDHPSKPCGIPIELADILIRVFDFCGEHGIDIANAVELKTNYNKKRPFRHGNKKL